MPRVPSEDKGTRLKIVIPMTATTPIPVPYDTRVLKAEIRYPVHKGTGRKKNHHIKITLSYSWGYTLWPNFGLSTIGVRVWGFVQTFSLDHDKYRDILGSPTNIQIFIM